MFIENNQSQNPISFINSFDWTTFIKDKGRYKQVYNSAAIPILFNPLKKIVIKGETKAQT